MNRRTLLAAALAAAAQPWLAAGAGGQALPALPGAGELWLNSPPLGESALAGRVVLLECWTYLCGNCRNTLPWLKRIHARYQAAGLVLIGVHTPEFDVERDPQRVRAALGELQIRYPVVLDPDRQLWQALGNRYWPAFYLYDRSHGLVATRIGELHSGEAAADGFEATIAALLNA